MKKILQFVLKFLAKRILAKYKPEIIGVTGSVGKTFAKEAISMVLAKKFAVRASQRNYNTEIGVPLNIIGMENQRKSFFGWCRVFNKAIELIFRENADYPKILVLEMAADKPGDIKYLVDFAKPQVGVITSVGATHLQFFGEVETVLEEKSNMIKYLNTDGVAVLNNDDVLVAGLAKKTKSKVLTFGLKIGADILADNIMVGKEKGGINFKLNYNGASVPVSMPYVLGKTGVYAGLAAVAVGFFYGMNLLEIAEAMKDIKSLPGRLNLIGGIKKTRIIDDSYNASPLAVRAALEVLSHIDAEGKKYVVFGDMLELGRYTDQAHTEVGEQIVKLGFDYLITVGERARKTASSARECGMNNDLIFSFDEVEEAGKFVQERMEQGDLILIKGSQGMRMEKVVKEIMAEPEKAEELLVRQTGIWKDK